MATQRFPQPSSSVLEQSKRTAFPSSIPAPRRTSTSSITSNHNLFASPASPFTSPNTPTTLTGIPTFRSLRSLLPFGPNKQVTPASASVPPSAQVSRSPFAGFGSVRRSNYREPRASLSSVLPVISIERSPDNSGEVTRKSSSCSKPEKTLPDELSLTYRDSSDPSRGENDTVVLSATAPTLRTPSPGPPLSADLSTILEADSSGISSLIPSSPLSLSPSPPIRSPTNITLEHAPTTPQSPDFCEYVISDVQTGESYLRHVHDSESSALDISTTRIANQVLDAMRAEDSETAKEWLTSDKAIVIDGDEAREDFRENLDMSLNLGSLDPDLATLLSPHRLLSSDSNTIVISHPRPSIDLSQPSPPSPNFPSSPHTPKFLPSLTSPIPPPEGLSLSPHKSAILSGLPRQQSSLPRLRATLGPSPLVTFTKISSSSDQDGMTSRNVSSDSLQTQTTQMQRRTTAPPSPLSASASTSASPPPRPTSRAAHRGAPQSSTVTPSFPTSSASARLLGMVKKRPSFRQIGSSPAPPTEWGELDNPSRYSPSLSSARMGSATMSRPSVESTSRGSIDSRARPSLDARPFRPSLESSYGIGDSTPVRPSIDAGRSSHDTQSNRDRSASIVRVRKRSMSVQERFGRHEQSASHALHDSARGDLRSSSSLSGRLNGQRGESVSGSASVAAGPPVTEWLGPRTAKAFKAAGLMDFDHERDRERTASPGNISSTGNGYSGLGRFASLRSTSEYSSRTHSRMALSEAGSGGGLGNSASRRGSETFSYGLMESPTFTVSSGSRDTPQSASTAPTSVSGSSLGFLGREREKDRERDDIRELKDKHATETGALLGALSDSQRTTRLLREENADLRGELDRLGHVDVENDGLRRTIRDLRKEVGDLRMKMVKSNSRLGTWNGNGIGRRSDLDTSNPTHLRLDRWNTRSSIERSWERDHDRLDLASEADFLSRSDRYERHEHDLLDGPALPSSTPVAISKRRFSTTSSIFPVPPSNMTMLLHEDNAGAASANQSRFSLNQSQKMSLRPHMQNNSIASMTNVSPTTANFSLVTGSPGSLFLKPEHEVHLGDMESLDLGVRSGGETTDDWTE